MDGWIILDKDSGIFSRTAGARVVRIFGEKKFGHIGTLDPMASGVLPVAIGRATKMIPFVENISTGEKEYLFDVIFGYSTDTLDITGTENARTDIVPGLTDVRDTCRHFTGKISQIPPMYSAVHIGGVRAYNAARCGQVLDIPPRTVQISTLECTGKTNDVFHFHMRCSRGTYVRSVARDIAQKIGTVATVSMIRRTITNPFTIKDAIKLDFLENLVNNGGAIDKYLLPIDYWLGGIPAVQLKDNKSVQLFQNGGFIGVSHNDCDLVRVLGNEFIGIGKITDGILRPIRVI